MNTPLSRLVRHPVSIRPKGRPGLPLHRVRRAGVERCPMLDCASSFRPSSFYRSRNRLVIRRHDDQQRIGSVRDNDGSPKKPSPVIAGREGHYAEDARENRQRCLHGEATLVTRLPLRKQVGPLAREGPDMNEDLIVLVVSFRSTESETCSASAILGDW